MMASLEVTDDQDVLNSLFANPPVSEVAAAKPNTYDDVMMTSVNRHHVQQQLQQHQWQMVRHHLHCLAPPADNCIGDQSSWSPSWSTGCRFQRPNLSRPVAALQWPRRESTYVTSSRNFPVLYGDRMPTGNRITAVPASAPGAHVLSAPVSQNDVIQPHHLYYQRQYEDGETVEQTPVSRHYGEAFFSNIDESPSSGVQTNMAYDYRPKWTGYILGRRIGANNASCRASVRPIFLQGWPVTSSDLRCFRDDQLSILFQYFERQLYPSACDYDHLASLTGLARGQVISWFRNHRAAWRRRLHLIAV